jgi:phage terminase large subunit GpA-like protein
VTRRPPRHDLRTQVLDLLDDHTTGTYWLTESSPHTFADAVIDWADQLPTHHEWRCPACGETTRARMADQEPKP